MPKKKKKREKEKEKEKSEVYFDRSLFAWPEK
jgi:hypothetical protein